jgi:hypothetical protein
MATFLVNITIHTVPVKILEMEKDIKIKEIKTYSCNENEMLGMRICIASKNSAAMLEHHCNSCDCCTHWQEYGINIITSFDVLY